MEPGHVKKKANPSAEPDVALMKAHGARTLREGAEGAEGAGGMEGEAGASREVLPRQELAEKKSLARSDEELFLKVREGCRESLAILVKRYEKSLFTFLVHLTGGDQSRSDDLFQETFLRAVRSAATFDANRKFKAWVFSIAVNLVRDQARRKKVQHEVALHGRDSNERGRPLEAKGETPEQSAERKDEAEKVRGALVKLTEKEREVILLHFFQGMTLSQSAETLTIPLGTVKSRLHGALTRLKGILR